MPLTPEQALAALKAGSGEAVKTALHKMDFSMLPPALAEQFNKMKTDLDAALTLLPPTEQVPAALDAGNMLTYAVERLCAMDRMLQEVLGGVAKMSASFHSAAEQKLASALPSAVKLDLDQKLAAGDYVTKQNHEAAVKSAAEGAFGTGVSEGLSRAQKHADRTALLKAAQLTAPEAVLTGDDSAFAAALATATARQTEAAKLQVHSQPFAYAFTNLFGEEAAWTQELGIAQAACAAANNAAVTGEQNHSARPGLRAKAEPNNTPPALSGQWDKVVVG